MEAQAVLQGGVPASKGVTGPKDVTSSKGVTVSKGVTSSKGVTGPKGVTDKRLLRQRPRKCGVRVDFVGRVERSCEVRMWRCEMDRTEKKGREKFEVLEGEDVWWR